MAAELLLLAGSPGSGKSTIGKKATELDPSGLIRHLSVGDRKRAIVSGEIASRFAGMLIQRENSERKTGAAPSSAIIGIMEEFIQERPSGLAIVDGFPRYIDRIQPFKQMVQRIGTEVLALCVVQTPEEIIRARLMERPRRTNQQLAGPEAIEERLSDHKNNIVPMIEVLRRDYPTYILDGTLPAEDNALNLLYIYARHSQRNTEG